MAVTAAYVHHTRLVAGLSGVCGCISFSPSFTSVSGSCPPNRSPAWDRCQGGRHGQHAQPQDVAHAVRPQQENVGGVNEVVQIGTGHVELTSRYDRRLERRRELFGRRAAGARDPRPSKSETVATCSKPADVVRQPRAPKCSRGNEMLMGSVCDAFARLRYFGHCPVDFEDFVCGAR